MVSTVTFVPYAVNFMALYGTYQEWLYSAQNGSKIDQLVRSNSEVVFYAHKGYNEKNGKSGTGIGAIRMAITPLSQLIYRVTVFYL